MPGEMRRASLIVSHGGAGSISEALACKKRVVVCVNESLMGNHQRELAEELRDRRHVALAKPHELADVVDDAVELVPYADYDPSLFPALLEDEMARPRLLCSIT